MMKRLTFITIMLGFLAAVFQLVASVFQFFDTLLKLSASEEVKAVKSTSLSITANNSLRRPIEVYIAGEPESTVIDPGKTMTLFSNNLPAQVVWKVIKATTKEGTPTGDEMGACWRKVYPDTHLQMTNIVGDQQYFYPVVSNTTGYDCEFTINKGYTTENNPGAYIPAYADDVVLGYYYFYPDYSNIVFDCLDGSTRSIESIPDVGDSDGYFCIIIQ